MPLDPRRVFAAVLVASLGTLGALPHVAEALNGIATPSLGGWNSPGQDDRCRVAEVVDGDTLTLACPGRMAERARLVGFDTPELFSPGCAGELVSATRAKRHLSRLVGRADHLGVVRHGRDRYGRTLVALSVDGRPVAREMISAGLARTYDGGRRGGWCGDARAGPVGRGTTATWVSG